MEVKKKPTRYIVVSGGVISGIGKGVIASSTGMLMKSFGLSVTSIKIDPYLNVDAGTMSPYEHGEVYILDDGGEVDLDLGNYERFMNISLKKDNNITTGKIYQSVIHKERRGDYLGKTVQVVPHICNEIQDWIEKVATTPADGQEEAPDVCIIEVGGTIGDIESAPFVEALRQFQFRVGKENFILMHVSLIPTIQNEQKTKPTQQSIRELRGLGLSPNFILCRSNSELSAATKTKISQFCHVDESDVIGVHDVSNLYRVPLLLLAQKLPYRIFTHFGKDMASRNRNVPLLHDWDIIAQRMDNLNASKEGVTIVITGKYVTQSDAYHSVIKGLQHASVFSNIMVKIVWVDSENLEESQPTEIREEAWKIVKAADGILVPGGFGNRGVEGKILVANYARLNNIPFFGICLGLQIAVIEYCRNVMGLQKANSEEFDAAAENKVVIFMPEIDKHTMGGTMRLGSRVTIFKNKSFILPRLYKKLWNDEDGVAERHRHRYEVNPQFIDQIEKSGLSFVGQDETGNRQEIIEIKNHQYFVAVQYHPEMKTRPMKPSPPFVGLVLASAKKLEGYLDNTLDIGIF
jgi:CTP synthase